ncbi:MAG TPA: hypothetical protein VF247_09620 [Candidatus Krumholzibacteria bacterium]
MRTRQLWVWMALALVAGCGSRKSNHSEEAVSELGVPSTPAVARRPYVLSESGIRFNPPPTWDVARIDVVSRTGEEAAAERANARFAVAFDYKAEQPAHKNAPLFNVYVLPKSRWSGDDNHSDGALIDSTDDWVYLAVPAVQNPYREGLLDADQFEAMRLSVDEIRAALSIENGGPADPTLQAESRR